MSYQDFTISLRSGRAMGTNAFRPSTRINSVLVKFIFQQASNKHHALVGERELSRTFIANDPGIGFESRVRQN
jgi:hypothetical protein